ncbi:MFS general substrate transporter [Dendrothele bispora CBS 962.96]|uniref:MFS general substrate transporter n=1 Tax=Dendrothele bispora (strain CBS 962.96) TaxID=1314807 RepID=A0A4S8L4U0_DENBC|nr:MFS general substrate transporter [Dendrothele bispora CBS 962.96]
MNEQSHRANSTSLYPRPPATPLPRFQVFILLMMRITEPISYTVIFPFINQMMEEVAHIPKAKVGYYAGLVESAFALVQFLFVYQWGALSDRVGRRVVALTGLGGVLISVLGFGLSKNLGMMIVTRCIAGAMNGNVAVVKSMLAEITDETNQARAFALLPAAYAVGSTIGPLLGGYLSHPVERYPVFERMGFVTVFLSDYPFFLPCFVGSLCNLSAIIFGYVSVFSCIHPSFPFPYVLSKSSTCKKHSPVSPNQRTPNLLHHHHLHLHVNRLSVKPRPLLNPPLFTPQNHTCPNHLVLPRRPQFLLPSSHPSLLLLPYSSGGVNFSPSQIGLLLSINGVTALISQTLIFPELEVRLGPARTYQLVITFLPIVFTCLPLAHWVYPLGSKMVWVVLGGMVAAKTISNMGAVCNNLLINNSAPSRESLGSLNGINQSTSSLARSFGPAGATTLFALSNEHHLLGGQLVHIVLVGIALVTWSLTMRLENVQPAWRKSPSSPSRRDLGSGSGSGSVSTSP